MAPTITQSSYKPTPLDKVRSDLNLEKWSIWQPSKSQADLKTRVIRREVEVEGVMVSAEVEVGFTHKGTLTTEDQKTLYGLLKIWEDRGKPTEQTFYSMRRLTKILHKRWGTNAKEATSDSLLRLRLTPIIWKNSYHDSSTGETAEVVDPFNILSDLKIITRKRDGHTTQEFGYFQFDTLIIRNLLNNHTKPILIDTVLSFKSEIAQLLYTHLDLVMARRSRYQRRTKALFVNLGLDGHSYRHAANRVQKLQAALKELAGAQLSTGMIVSAALEKTSDSKDSKIVIEKGQQLELPLALDEGRKDVDKEPFVESAQKLVAHFYRIFHGIESAHVSAKAHAQAVSLLATHGGECARYLVDFSHQAAQKTNYQPQTFGGILQYTSQALEAYEREQRREVQREEKRREETEQRFWHIYADYHRTEIERLMSTLPEGELVDIERTVRAEVEKEGGLPYIWDLLVKQRVRNLLAERFGLPSFEQWKAQYETGASSS